MKKLSGALVLFTSMMLVWPGFVLAAQALETVVTLKAGVASSLTGSTHGIGLVKLREWLEKESNGRIRMQIQHGGQMGGDLAMMESLKTGALDIMVSSSAPIARISKPFMLCDLPFLFPNENAVDAVLNGPIGQEILDTLKGTGLVGLAYWNIGFRSITNNQRPINTLDDLKGLKIRTMQNPVHFESFKQWGALPVQLPFNEVPAALEQKLVDGQENPETIICDAGFYETQKYLTITRHFYTPFVLLISQKRWDGLSGGDQELIQKLALRARDYAREVNRQNTPKCIDLMKKKGVSVNELSVQERERFKAASRGIYEKFSREIGEKRLNMVLEETAKAR